MELKPKRKSYWGWYCGATVFRSTQDREAEGLSMPKALHSMPEEMSPEEYEGILISTREFS